MKRRLSLASGAALAILLASAILASGPDIHELSVRGSHGWLKFKGIGKIHLEGRGTLVVKNVSNMNLDLQGTWDRIDPQADGATYWGFKGSLDAYGTGINVDLRGWDQVMTFRGREGRAWMRGEGTYSLDGGPDLPWVDHPDKWAKVTFGR
jgi:hypothetical protein